eukprot:CAMPEP_0117665968 /NCGR_PEP_ID=MMETSP0804-20121206/10107_1 /TAXON_ID=1074897 /ORGANISM="Tetraselmis astigmatica, Strain CCMP880" /LENGTH=356 /DNA_ID=CAMNT_0005473445 /DNA_START=290 /DNA_END=1359 /DNA_ORIENTATION=-
MMKRTVSALMVFQVLLASICVSLAQDARGFIRGASRYRRLGTQKTQAPLEIPPDVPNLIKAREKVDLQNRAEELDMATQDTVLTDELISRHIPSAQPPGWLEGRYRPFHGKDHSPKEGSDEELENHLGMPATAAAKAAGKSWPVEGTALVVDNGPDAFQGNVIKGMQNKPAISRVPRAAIASRISRSPMLTRIARMKVSVPRIPGGSKYVDPKTGYYIDKSKPSQKGAIKMARDRAATNPPLVVDWGDGIDPEHAPKDYVAMPAKMAAVRAKVVAARGGADATCATPATGSKGSQKARAKGKTPETGDNKKEPAKGSRPGQLACSATLKTAASRASIVAGCTSQSIVAVRLQRYMV